MAVNEKSMKAQGDAAIVEAIEGTGASWDGDVLLIPGKPGSIAESIEVQIPDDMPMTIFPDQPEIKDVAKLLLELADHPRQVATTLDPTIGFTVPFWLYKVFVETWDLRLGKDEAAPVPAAEAVSEPNETIEPVARRKPGRPRKES